MEVDRTRHGPAVDLARLSGHGYRVRRKWEEADRTHLAPVVRLGEEDRLGMGLCPETKVLDR